MCLTFAIKTRERRHYRRSGAIVATFEPIQVINMVFLLLNMNIYLHDGLSQDLPEVTTGGVLWKKMFLEISQNSQENTCARDFF